MSAVKKMPLCIAFILVVVFESLAQTIQSASLVETVSPVRNLEGNVVARETKFILRVIFSQAPDSTAIFDKRSWSVFGNNKPLIVDSITWRAFAKTIVRIYGPYRNETNLTVGYQGGDPVLVGIDSVTTGKTRWGIGTGKALDLNIRRLTAQKAFVAFDYDLSAKILEHNIAVPNGSLWLRSFSLDVQSTGTFGSDDTVRNGTASALALSAHSYYFAGGLIYQGKLSLSYQLETGMNASENKLFDVVNQSLKLGLSAEVPYSNYPMFALHTATGYARLAMPITLKLDYLPAGEDPHGRKTSARWDLAAMYELAFSPYLIVQGEWRRSWLDTPPSDVGSNVSYYSVAFAQDLDVVKESFELLKILLGNEKAAEGKHFIFYKISDGRKPPLFQNVREHSIGFGTYF